MLFANRLLVVYDGLEMEASACRLRVTITLLQLEAGDVVAVSLFSSLSLFLFLEIFSCYT